MISYDITRYEIVWRTGDGGERLEERERQRWSAAVGVVNVSV